MQCVYLAFVKEARAIFKSDNSAVQLSQIDVSLAELRTHSHYLKIELRQELRGFPLYCNDGKPSYRLLVHARGAAKLQQDLQRAINCAFYARHI